MQSSPLLPPQPASPADVAAALPVGREPASEAGEGSFGAVLESKLNTAAAPEAPSGTDATAAASSAAATVQPPGDAVLASLMASLAGAGSVPTSQSVPLAAQAPAAEGEADPALPAAIGSMPSRAPLSEAAVRADRAPKPGDAAAEAAAKADSDSFARLLPSAAGTAPGLAAAVSLEAPKPQLSLDTGVAQVRVVPDATPRADALPVAVAAAGDAPAESAALPRVPVPASFGSQGWNGAFADRVTWIAQARQPSAELTLNPPQLGPVEVRVSVSADQQATLSFHSPHAAVREAIQGSLPRLQEAFAASGLQLGDVFVGSGAAGFGRDQAQSRDDGRESARRGGSPAGGGAVAPAAVASWVRAGSLGQVDLFA